MTLIVAASALCSSPALSQPYESHVENIDQSVIEHCERGAADAAIRACSIVIRDAKFGVWDQLWAAYVNRGAAYTINNDIADAIADFDKALELRPDDPSALDDRCYARVRGNIELALALADCSRSLELRPRFAASLVSRGCVYLLLNRLDDAIGDFDTVLAAADRLPDFPFAPHTETTERGDHEVRFRKNDDIVRALYGRGIAEMRKGDISRGQADMARAESNEPDVEEFFAELKIAP